MPAGQARSAIGALCCGGLCAIGSIRLWGEAHVFSWVASELQCAARSALGLQFVQALQYKPWTCVKYTEVALFAVGRSLSCMVRHCLVCDYHRPSWNGSTKTAMHSKFCPEQEV
jgi:hypothetical protein